MIHTTNYQLKLGIRLLLPPLASQQPTHLVVCRRGSITSYADTMLAKLTSMINQIMIQLNLRTVLEHVLEGFERSLRSIFLVDRDDLIGIKNRIRLLQTIVTFVSVFHERQKKEYEPGMRCTYIQHLLGIFLGTNHPNTHARHNNPSLSSSPSPL
jgi:hypothetical protein